MLDASMHTGTWLVNHEIHHKLLEWYFDMLRQDC